MDKLLSKVAELILTLTSGGCELQLPLTFVLDSMSLLNFYPSDWCEMVFLEAISGVCLIIRVAEHSSYVH